MRTFIQNTVIVNEGTSFRGSLLIGGTVIRRILREEDPDYAETSAALAASSDTVIDGEGSYLIPGVIDDQVHFREPGAVHKGDIASESAAAVLGGTTTFMDMPNNNPPACSLDALERKYCAAQERSFANYSFYLGADNDNIEEIRRMDPQLICGVKVFMGSSTGNMLVDSEEALGAIFREAPTLVATHCEEESIIRENLKKYEGQDLPFRMHPVIRSREGCIASTKKAIALAEKYGTRLHVLHISTAEELEMIAAAKKISDRISGEICVHYLWFDDEDYDRYGAMIKCNPAIKSRRDRDAIRAAVRDSGIDAVATDHAPHLPEEKNHDYRQAPSGIPTIQHSLQMMLQLSEQGCFPITQVVEMMCHAPARCFQIRDRGFIRKDYRADLVLVKKQKYKVTEENIASKCGWSPLLGQTFDYTITDTFVNGTPTVQNGRLTGERSPERLLFNRQCHEK